jgi:hypothetical protein
VKDANLVREQVIDANPVSVTVAPVVVVAY